MVGSYQISTYADNKKSEPAGKQVRLFCCLFQKRGVWRKLAAAPAAAGATSAAVLGSDGKSILDKVDDLVIGKAHYLGIKEYVDIVNLLLCVVVI